MHLLQHMCATRAVVLAVCDGATLAVACHPLLAWGLGHGRGSLVFKLREDAAFGKETDHPWWVQVKLLEGIRQRWYMLGWLTMPLKTRMWRAECVSNKLRTCDIRYWHCLRSLADGEGERQLFFLVVWFFVLALPGGLWPSNILALIGRRSQGRAKARPLPILFFCGTIYVHDCDWTVWAVISVSDRSVNLRTYIDLALAAIRMLVDHWS